MIEESVLKAAERLARRISQTPSITEADLMEDAAGRVAEGENPETAALIVQLGKWAAPFFSEGARDALQQHGGLIAALHEQMSPHKDDTEHLSTKTGYYGISPQ